MSKKRLIVSFVAVCVLLAVAGIDELLIVMLPAAAEEAPGPADELSGIVESILDQAARPTDEEVQAAELVKTSAIILDGAPLQRAEAESIVHAAGPFASAADHIDQRGVLKSGCEIVSLAVAMRAEGYDVSPAEIADDHMRYGGDFTVDYIGSPRAYGGGFPACIADAGNSWLAGHGAPGRAFNLTGTTFQGVVGLVELGYPVLTWTTEGLANPVRTGTAKDGLQWYRPEHCVVVHGFEGEEVLVSDPLAGLVRRDRAAFERVYDACGKLAVFVRP